MPAQTPSAKAGSARTLDGTEWTCRRDQVAEVIDQAVGPEAAEETRGPSISRAAPLADGGHDIGSSASFVADDRGPSLPLAWAWVKWRHGRAVVAVDEEVRDRVRWRTPAFWRAGRRPRSRPRPHHGGEAVFLQDAWAWEAATHFVLQGLPTTATRQVSRPSTRRWTYHPGR